MKNISILAMAAVAGATIVVACGGGTKSSSNGDDDSGTGGNSSGGANSSSGANSSGGGTGDAESMTIPLGDSGYSLTETLACMSEQGCSSGDKCYATIDVISESITSACSSAAPATTGFVPPIQLCASASECTTGDVCEGIASGFGAGAGGGAASYLPSSIADLTGCFPEAGTTMMNDAGCYVYEGMTYCVPDGGYTMHHDGGSTGSDAGSTTPGDATTTPATDGSAGGD